MADTCAMQGSSDLSQRYLQEPFNVEDKKYDLSGWRRLNCSKSLNVWAATGFFTLILLTVGIYIHHRHINNGAAEKECSNCVCAPNDDYDDLSLSDIRNISQSAMIEAAEIALGNFIQESILFVEKARESSNCSLDFIKDESFLKTLKNITHDVMFQAHEDALRKISSDKNHFPKNCASLLIAGDDSGVRNIYPHGKTGVKIEVFCDQDTDGGGWTVIQRRDVYPRREDFNRNWNDYVQGFGNLKQEFWLGLENIHQLTTSTTMVLQIDLEDWDGQHAYAKFKTFSTGNADTKYQLTIGDYSGNAGDSFSASDLGGMAFATFDNDNVRECAERKKGGWWYNNCGYVNLNGQALVRQDDWSGLIYHSWKSSYYSMKKAVMKVKPLSS